MVRDIELDESETAERARRDAGDAFLAMPFEEAVNFFFNRRLISEAEFDELRDRYRQGGFIARRLASERLQEVARDSIERLLAQEMTIPEVVQAIRDAERDEIVGLGISPASHNYLDTVIRTGVATAYGHGRWRQMNDPQVVALRPYARYVSAGDGRVRDSHRELHGKVFRVGTDEHSYYAPPLGFRCRCQYTTLSERQFQQRGYVLTQGRIAGVDPDKGWEGTPAPLSDDEADEFDFDAVFARIAREGLSSVEAHPTRPLTNVLAAYEGATQSEIDAISTGAQPPKNSVTGVVLPPIQISVEPSGRVELTDGNHRLAGARQVGATRISADVRVYADADRYRTRTMILAI